MRQSSLMLALLAASMVLVACGGSEPPAPAKAADAKKSVGESAPVAQQAAQAPAAVTGEPTLAGSMESGKRAYAIQCAACHQADGKGLARAFPPLAGSDYLMADKTRSISTVLNGLQGPITVNGVEYNSMMPPMPQLDDQTVANILTYVRNSWGNEGEPVTAAEVAAVRAGK